MNKPSTFALLLALPLASTASAQYFQGQNNNGQVSGWVYNNNSAAQWGAIGNNGALMTAAGLQSINQRRALDAQRRAQFNELNTRREIAGLKPLTWEEYNGEAPKKINKESSASKAGLRTTR